MSSKKYSSRDPMGAGGGLKVLLTWIIRTVSFSQYTFTTHCIAGEGGADEPNIYKDTKP
jgi:hypothetical protein